MYTDTAQNITKNYNYCSESQPSGASESDSTSDSLGAEYVDTSVLPADIPPKDHGKRYITSH